MAREILETDSENEMMPHDWKLGKQGARQETVLEVLQSNRWDYTIWQMNEIACAKTIFQENGRPLACSPRALPMGYL